MTVQSAMLVGLGFLAATLLLLLLAPTFWARAVRLTADRIKASMPVTETEIRADRDRLNAEHAVRVHRLEVQIEQTRLSAARQLIEINRRDARVNALEADLQALKSELEEAVNARRVLELTVADRLPRVEQRLTDAKKQLDGRDEEIQGLKRSANRQAQALAEAKAITEQQASEVTRLTTALETAAARNKGGLADARFDGEVALKSELESLRARAREQAALIARLQSAANDATVAAEASERRLPRFPAIANTEGDEAAMARELATLRRTREAQDAEIGKLKAALSIYAAAATDQAVKDEDSRIALKARLGASNAENKRKDDLIDQLRAEIAALREQAAQQLAHFAAETRRLGAGTLPAAEATAAQAPEPARETLAARVAFLRRAAAPVDEKTDAAAEANDTAAAPPVANPPGPQTQTEPTAATARGERRPRLLDRISSLSKA